MEGQNVPDLEQMDASIISTDSLRLIAVEPFHVEALSRDKRELAEVLGVAVPSAAPTR